MHRKNSVGLGATTSPCPEGNRVRFFNQKA